MGLNQYLQSCFILITYFLVISVSDSTLFISDAVFGEEHDAASATGRTGTSGRRNILQAKQNCPVNFESQDYSVITKECKGPHYPATECCAAFKLFACPFSDQINDLSNNCASTMFSYINLAGKYPPGLFANECKEGKAGLACDDAQSPSSLSSNNTSAASATNPSPFLLLALPLIAFRLLHSL